MSRIYVVAAVLFAAMLPAGCSSAYTPVPVSGVVTLDGKPVEAATVTFYRTDGDGEGRLAVGRTNANGEFEMTTMHPGDGVLPGDYVVAVTKQVPGLPNLKIPNFPDTPEGKAMREDFIEIAYRDKPRVVNKLPPKYGDQNSPFRFKVADTMRLTLELSSK